MLLHVELCICVSLLDPQIRDQLCGLIKVVSLARIPNLVRPNIYNQKHFHLILTFTNDIDLSYMKSLLDTLFTWEMTSWKCHYSQSGPVQRKKSNRIHLICHMSRIMRKPDFCICENKGADQLCSNCTADQHLCFR